MRLMELKEKSIIELRNQLQTDAEEQKEEAELKDRMMNSFNVSSRNDASIKLQKT